MNVFDLAARLILNKDDYDKGLSDAESSASGFGSRIGSVFSGTAKVIGAGIAAGAAGVTALTKSAVEAYANYEQLVGGVETLFGDAADLMMEYAKDAYKTTGLSQNAYMETVTSFAAALTKSVEAAGGSIDEAVEYADTAMLDMADNANKMGTDMSAIQNAYQGFAKQNYTMLDNLKLGYGGTKEEMGRLIDDANKLREAQGISADLTIESYADIITAIHEVQTEMGITGTTAAEASSTISGSVASMKAAWQNLVVGIADDNQDFDTLVNNFVEGVSTAASNIIPRIETALGGVGRLVESLAPIIADELPAIVEEIVPSLLTAATSLFESVVDALPDLINLVVEEIPVLLSETLPIIISAGASILAALGQGVIDNLPLLVDTALDLVNQFVGYISNPESLTSLMNGAITIIQSLTNFLVQSLPVLIPAVLDLIMEIASQLMNGDNLTVLLDAALQIITELAFGLVDAIPALVDSIYSIINGIVEFLLNPENIVKLVTAAIQIVIALATGLVNAIPQLLEGVGKLILALINQVLDTDWADLGKQVVNGIWEGLKRAWEGLKKWFTDAWDNLVGGVKDLLGIHSPSRVFAEIGENMAAGVTVGWDDKFDEVRRDVEGDFDMDIDPTFARATTSVQSRTDEDRIQEFIDTFFENLSEVLSDVNLDIDGRTFGRLVKRVV